ncbi:MAG: guanylate kinase [Chloroflexi bacterium]|nr:guanylate kinase [Chloroflexota bacterium]
MDLSFSNAIPHTEPLIIIISGPSAAGKDSVIHALRDRNLPIHFVITANTRRPRPGEEDGKDYFFITREKFREMIKRGEFLEHSKVYTDYKGVPKEQVRLALASGKDVVFRVDVQGAAKVRRLCPEAVLIFLLPSSEEALRERIAARPGDKAEDIQVRMNTIRKELGYLDKFDYLVINPQGNLEVAVDDILAIISAEHHRVHQRKACL